MTNGKNNYLPKHSGLPARRAPKELIPDLTGTITRQELTIVFAANYHYLLLPPSLKGYAELTKDMVLMATGEKLEIWDSNKYKQFFDSISSDALSALGSEVLGSKKPE